MRYNNSNNKKRVEDPLWAEPIKKELEGSELVVKFKKVISSAEAPEYKSKDAAGMDLKSAEQTCVKVGRHAVVTTGLAMEIPSGYEAQIRPRSGLAAKNGVTVLNSPGTIDSDYRGEVKVILINHGSEDFQVNVGDRIAQMVIAKVEQARIAIVTQDLSETERGSGGLGSTGVR